ncbi:hypothetical protein IJO12_04820 [bacterium]|nr:hypothetical protein [bacterium]
MSIVDNIQNQILIKDLSNGTKPNGLGMNTDAFADFLEKAMATMNVQNPDEPQAISLGIPSGLIIEPLEGTEPIQDIEYPEQIYNEEPFKIQDIEIGKDYFTDLLKNSSKEHSEFLHYAQKQASNAYSSFRTLPIDNMKDFIGDVMTMVMR